MIKEYSKEHIAQIRRSPSPRVLLNVCTHGSEQVGLRVLKHFKGIKPATGTLVCHVANKKAAAKNKRFIDHDLNRVFPGKKKGSYEEMLAHTLTPFVGAFDVVIDVHSTESGMTSSLIVTSVNTDTKALIRAIGPRQAIHMQANESSALISNAPVGIAFEYGKDRSERTYRETVVGITKALEHLHVLPSKKRSQKSVPTDMYVALGTLDKPEGFKVYSRIKNFTLIKKGEPVGYHPVTKKQILAPHDFYPILFGKNSYKTMFGFIGKKIRL